MTIEYKENSKQLIAILGPTASGKSDLAIRLARKFNGEIISADSRQVYRGLDLTTGKVTKKERRVVRHHCIDFADPPKRWREGAQSFSVHQYRQCADAALQDIWSRGKVPFLVGGSHLYVRAVLYNYNLPPVSPDALYREILEKKSLQELQQQLYHVDSIMRRWSDRNNKRRVIRALEIYHATGQKPSRWHRTDTGKGGMTLRYDSLQLCIDVPREVLYRRIDARVDERIRKGMIREVERLRESGVSKKWLRSLGLECRFISDFLDARNIPYMGHKREEMIQRLKYATHDFARRQLMWYRKEHDITSVTSYADAAHKVRKFLIVLDKNCQFCPLEVL